jgi:zinc protease
MSAAGNALLSTSSEDPIVIVEPSRALPLVSMTIALRTGSQEDPAGKEGLTRFMARLMRRTGGGLTSQELDTRIDALGGSLGADVGVSSASFNGAVIARSLGAFTDLLISVVAAPSFAADELTHLKRESEGELIEARDNDRALAQRWFRRKFFAGHPYGRTVSGTVGTVQSFADADVRELYERSLQAKNLVFAFGGDIDRERATEIRDRVMAALPQGERRPDTVPEPTQRSGRHLVIVDKPERTQTQILIGTLGTHPHDPDHTALHVANTVFGGTFTARMTQQIRSERGWSYGAYSDLSYDRRRQAFSMWTFPKASDAAPCIRLQLEMLEHFCKDGITPKELAWAKRYLARSHAFSVDTAAKRVGLALDSELYGLPPGYHEKYVERISAITLDEANAAVRARISPADLLVVVVGTEAEVGGQIREAIDRLDSSEVVPFDTND